MSKAVLNQKRLHDLIDYNPDTGVLIWKTRPRNDFVLELDWKSWNTRFSGKPAGWRDNSGYGRLNLDKKMPRAHQVAWVYMHGDIPDGCQIDHINGRRDDNRISNLRAVPEAENRRNMARSKRNKSGTTGVYWIARHAKWMARVTYDRRIIHLGLFEVLDEAVAARKAAEKQYGFHENHGRVS
jgi:hypothetical protein